MISLPLLAVGVLMTLVAILFVFVCVVLVLAVLIQKGRGGGLSGAFGGGMASGLLGSKTGDFLTWVTIGLFVVFLGLAVLMARYFRPSVGTYGDSLPAPASVEQTTPAAPAASPQPAPTSETPAVQAPAQDAPAGGQ
ncbi:MAG TPA: preprotein translocase subunit SecG [Sedimentisphaerales bacterium]|nr:preprotein translocase subunit SecG [Sedimentisphaerales bacterium]